MAFTGPRLPASPPNPAAHLGPCRPWRRRKLITIEYIDRPSRAGQKGTHRVVSFPGTSRQGLFISVIHVVQPVVADLPAIRQDVAGAVFQDVVLVLQLDTAPAENKRVLRTCKSWRRYFSMTLVVVDDQRDLDVWGLLGEIRRELPVPAQVSLDRADSLDVEGWQLQHMDTAVRGGHRLRFLSHISYYRESDVVTYKARDVTHLNLLAFLAQHAGFHFDFDNCSLLEIGPGAGYFYRYAQSVGAAQVYVVDKNPGFCALAQADGAVTVECHLTDERFDEALGEQVPPSVDYVFAKGVGNVYSFAEEAPYRKLVQTLTSRISKAGVWVTYNVDRQNGPDPRKIAWSEAAFRDGGWEKIKVPATLCNQTGLNFYDEVDWSLWVHRGRERR